MDSSRNLADVFLDIAVDKRQSKRDMINYYLHVELNRCAAHQNVRGLTRMIISTPLVFTVGPIRLNWDFAINLFSSPLQMGLKGEKESACITSLKVPCTVCSKYGILNLHI